MTAVVHLHIHLEHITDNTARAIRLILDGIEAGLAADQIDTTEPPPPPAASITIPEIILPDEVDQAGRQLVCSTCGTTRYTDLRGLRSHERSHETILCHCGRTISRSGLGPHRKHCPGPPTNPVEEPVHPTVDRRSFDPDEARRRAARAAIGEE